MKRQQVRLAVLWALSAPLAAHPLDDAGVWVYEDAPSGAEARPEATATQPGAPDTFFITVFPETDGKRPAREAPARRAANVAHGAEPEGRVNAWTASLGYRRETLDWSIAGTNGFPDVLSRLDWDVEMAELRINGEWMAANGFTIAVEGAYASAFSGEVRDSDYDLDRREHEFSRSYSESHRSTASRVALGLGWRILPHSRVGLTPMLGYAYQEQDLRARHGRQVLSEPCAICDADGDGIGGDIITPPVGTRLTGLDIHYQPRWHGPWLGLRLDARIGSRFGLHVGAKYQWFNYRANADWNLREEFAHPRSYTHHGDSRGWQGEIGMRWRLSAQSAITLTVDQHQQRLKRGTDRTFFADGRTSKTRLNDVNWDSWGAALGWRVEF
ncbi:MAG: omptin family outer membrane protease [Azoarcus sp.]|jgi:hypothetical protein|nr:omptin family outer membrane protease [Azoarcus sp.]